MTVTIYPGRAAGTAAAPPSRAAPTGCSCAAHWQRGERHRGHLPQSGHAGHRGLHPRHGRRVPSGGRYGLHHRHRRTYPPRRDIPLPRERQHPAVLHPSGTAVRRQRRVYRHARLMERGVSVYETILAQKGISVSRTWDAVTFSGRLTPGDYTLRGDVSSQFVTGLLLALPLLPDSSTLRVLPPVESRPYIDITLDIMAAFGVGWRSRSRTCSPSPAASGTPAAARRWRATGQRGVPAGAGRRRHRHRPAPRQSAGRPGVPRHAAPAGKSRRGAGHLRLPRSGAHTVRCGGAELRRRVHRNPPPAHQGE